MILRIFCRWTEGPNDRFHGGSGTQGGWAQEKTKTSQGKAALVGGAVYFPTKRPPGMWWRTSCVYVVDNDNNKKNNNNRSPESGSDGIQGSGEEGRRGNEPKMVQDKENSRDNLSLSAPAFS